MEEKELILKFGTWFDKCNDLVKKRDDRESLGCHWGPRYIRVWRNQSYGGKSAYAFIDLANGNVLKPNSWKAPHKTPRGNLFNEDNGLTGMDAHGPAYLR